MGIEADEVEPAEVVGQVLGGDAAERPQEAFDLLVAAVDRLDMEFAAHPLASRLDQGLVLPHFRCTSYKGKSDTLFLLVYAAARTRWRSRSKLARPYICRFTSLSLLI